MLYFLIYGVVKRVFQNSFCGFYSVFRLLFWKCMQMPDLHCNFKKKLLMQVINWGRVMVISISYYSNLNPIHFYCLAQS